MCKPYEDHVFLSSCSLLSKFSLKSLPSHTTWHYSWSFSSVTRIEWTIECASTNSSKSFWLPIKNLFRKKKCKSSSLIHCFCIKTFIDRHFSAIPQFLKRKTYSYLNRYEVNIWYWLLNNFYFDWSNIHNVSIS